MGDYFSGNKQGEEGYVYNTYGKIKYLKHAVASVSTLRRYDKKRPVAIFCSDEHADLLKQEPLEGLFTHIFHLPEENRSITGFKHNIDRFMPFEKNIYIDSDIVWCKKTDQLWKAFSPYDFTITGNQSADNFFGGPKGVGIIRDILLRRRNRTLKRFGLTYLPRVQSGVIYTRDYETTKNVCDQAKAFLDEKHRTHFRHRSEEAGRSEESCEWSLAMAMAELKIKVYPWFNGHESPQLDYIDTFTVHDDDFQDVECLYYTNKTVYNFRGFPVRWIQKFMIGLYSLFPGKGDYLYVTPYCLHFGWYHQKEPFFEFSERVWEQLHQ